MFAKTAKSTLHFFKNCIFKDVYKPKEIHNDDTAVNNFNPFNNDFQEEEDHGAKFLGRKLNRNGFSNGLNGNQDKGKKSKDIIVKINCDENEIALKDSFRMTRIKIEDKRTLKFISKYITTPNFNIIKLTINGQNLSPFIFYN